MISEFVRFPHTPHLAWLGERQPRSDKVLDPDESVDILSTPVVVEEKVDGANLGLSVIDGSVRVQNRGSILENRAHPQFQPLWAWLAAREATIRARLGTSLILRRMVFCPAHRRLFRTAGLVSRIRCIRSNFGKILVYGTSR